MHPAPGSRECFQVPGSNKTYRTRSPAKRGLHTLKFLSSKILHKRFSVPGLDAFSNWVSLQLPPPLRTSPRVDTSRVKFS